MLKVARSFVSALLCGIVMGVGAIAHLYFYAKEKDLVLAALVLAGTFFAIEILGLKLYVTKTAEFLFSKKKEDQKLFRLFAVCIGNLLGVLFIALLLNGNFQNTAGTYYTARSAAYSKVGGDVFSGFLGGILVFVIHRIYVRSENSVVACGLAALLLVPALLVPYVDFGALVVFALTVSKNLKMSRLYHCGFVLLGNLFGGAFAAALSYLIRQLDRLAERNADGRLYKRRHHHHHHHSHDKETAEESENS